MSRVIAALLASLCAASSAFAQSYKADVPQSITTPDSVDTRIGTLKFFDGLPAEATVQKVYDQLDFSRGIEAFLSGMPAASVYALCEGLDKAGIKRNHGIEMTEDLMDARPFSSPRTRRRSTLCASTFGLVRWSCKSHPMCWGRLTTPFSGT